MSLVHVPTHLRSYTGGSGEVDVPGSSLAEVLRRLDERFPGFRFRVIDEQDRIRPHIKIYIKDTFATTIADPVAAADEVHIIAALSGG